jgi:hypothetical protein
MTPATRATSIPTVFGALSIVFAAIGMLSGLSNGCTALSGHDMARMTGLTAMPGGGAAANLLEMFDGIYLGVGLQGLVLLVFSPVLLAVGIGQLRYRRWARAWSVYWGGAALVGVAAMVLITMLVIGPAYQGYFDLFQQRAAADGYTAPSPLSGLGGLMAGDSATWMVLCYAPYPVLLLVFFRRGNVKQAMSE